MTLKHHRRAWFRWGGSRRGWLDYRAEQARERARLGLRVAVLGVRMWMDLGGPTSGAGRCWPAAARH